MRFFAMLPLSCPIRVPSPPLKQFGRLISA
jgi:hypothetical protein